MAEQEKDLRGINAEINAILSGSSDTIYFDSNTNTFVFECGSGSEIGISWNRLIDIL